MNDKYDFYEQFDDFEFNSRDRQAHRQRNGRFPKNNKSDSKKVPTAADFTDFNDNIADFVPSYVEKLDPKHHERQWVINSVGDFYRNDLISDVTRLVKGGKEANVYVCIANPATGHNLLAAKLYRPRMLRTLKNNAIYKEGRMLYDGDGGEIKGGREARALKNKTRFGKHLDIYNWISHEFGTQKQLFNAGADVPEPVAISGNTILMQYFGNESNAAPVLSDVSVTNSEAKRFFEQVMHNVELMLANRFIHGDLSAYNILYWQGEITIIDFPQLANALKNPNAFMLLERDIQRVADYFGRFGVRANPTKLAADLWDRFQHNQL